MLTLIIHPQRHYCQSLLPLETGHYLQLFFGQEQFSGAGRVILLGGIAGLIGGYTHPPQVCLAASDYCVSAFDLSVLATQSFDLAAQELQTRLVLLEDLVVEPRLFVLQQAHLATIPYCRHPFTPFSGHCLHFCAAVLQQNYPDASNSTLMEV